MAGMQNDSGTLQQEAGFGFNGRFWTESYTDSLVAATAATQAGATQLPSMFNRIATCATTGNSMQLPPSAPGLSIYLINAGATSAQVFAQNGSTDTINGVAGSTGVVQMSGSVSWYSCTTAGTWLAQGLGSGYSGSNQTYSYADALTANSGGVQSGATPITTSIARFTTVGGAGYSAVLMAAAPGLSITVINAGANIMTVWPAGTDQINSLGASNAFALPVGAVAEFFSTVAGQWHTVLSAAGGAQQAYNAIATVAGSITLTGAQITGGTEEVTVDLTGTQAGAVTLNLPTVANLIAAMTVAGLNPQPGMSYELDIIARDASHTYTVTTATGWTLNNTMTVTTQMRKFYVTLTSLTAAVLQSIGTFTIGAR